MLTCYSLSKLGVTPGHKPNRLVTGSVATTSASGARQPANVPAFPVTASRLVTPCGVLVTPYRGTNRSYRDKISR
jgi:hypothetical protein